MGAGRFRDLPADATIGRVDHDMRQVAELFSEYGYEHVLRGVAEYAAPDHIRNALAQWTRDAGLGAEDIVVFYFAGHGVVEERDRHYLLCWSSSDQQPAATALPAEDVVRILLGNGLRNLLLVLDTCYGGAGGADAATVALQTVARRVSSDRTSTGLWFLSSARAKDEAVDGAFVDVLRPAIGDVAARSGQRQQYVDLADLIGEINVAYQRRNLSQRAELIAGLVTGLPPFIPNAAYRPRLPPVGTDLEVQTRVAARDVDIAEHFGPRSRGVEFESEQGMYFSGRQRVLRHLVDWLTAPTSEGRGRIVTGNPGCGKSAVLGRIVSLSSPGYRATTPLIEVDPRTIIPENTVHVAIHARHKRLEEVVARFAADLGLAADSPAALLYELSRRDRNAPPIVAVIDALDEAGSGTSADTGGRGEPRRIARDLLRPMSEIVGIRLLVGTRRELIPNLGSTFELLDLDTATYAADEDIAGYVAAVLLAADEPDIKTPYRSQPEVTAQVGRAVAERAAGVYLVARMVARSLRDAPQPVDMAEPGWIERLPSEVGQAFDDYLARFEDDEERVRRLLMPLALAEGQGLPRGDVWLRLATALSGVATTDADIAWALKAASSYIAEVTDNQGRSVYRLYHQALAEHLRHDPTLDAVTAQRRVVDALVSLVPSGVQGRHRDWFAAHSYVHAHLATHAAAADRIDGLISDPGFLLASEQLPLLRALATARSADARRIRNAYEQVAHHVVSDKPLGERAAYLQLSARRCDATDLASSIDRLGASLPWSTRWAWWSRTGVHRQLRGHEAELNAVSVGLLDGRPIALTGSGDGTARIWDLTTQRQLGVPMRGHKDATAVAFCELGEYTVAVTGGDDGTVWVFDMSTSQELGAPLTGHTNQINAIALGRMDGIEVAVTASDDGTARVWDLMTRHQIGDPFALHRSAVNGVALGVLAGRTIVVTGGDDNRAWVWDAATRQPIGSALIGHVDAIVAVTLARLDEEEIVVTGCADGTVGFWSLETRHQLGEPLRAHVGFGDEKRIRSVAVGELGGNPILVTCARHDARVWNLGTRRRIGQPLTGHVGIIYAAALGTVNGMPTLVTAGGDRTARIWDLTAENPTVGHTGDIQAVATCVLGQRHLAITGGDDTTARIWDLTAQQQLGDALEGHTGPVTAVAIGRHGGRDIAVTGSTDATIRLWDLDTRRPLTAPLTGHTNAITIVMLGEYAGQPAIVSGSEDGTVRIWSPATGLELNSPLTGHRGGVRRLAAGYVDGMQVLLVATAFAGYVWSLDSTRQKPVMVGTLEADETTRFGRILEVGVINGRPVLLTTGANNMVRFWDVLHAHETAHRLIGHTEYVTTATLETIDGGTMVATSSSDRTLRFWNTSDGRQIGRAIPLQASTCRIARFGSYVVVCGRDVMRVWDARTSQPVGEPLSGLNSNVATIGLGKLAAAETVVAGDQDAIVRFHDPASGEPVAPQLIAPRYSRSATLVPDDGRLTMVMGGWLENKITIWDARYGRLIETLHGHTGPLRVFAFGNASDRPLMISGSADATLRIWDRRTWQQIGEPLTGHTASINALVVCEVDDKTVMASAGDDGTVRLWDLPSGRPLGDPLTRQDHSFDALAFDRHGNRTLLTTGDERGEVKVWDLTSRQYIRSLTPPDDTSVTTLWAGTLGNRSLVVIGDSTGRVRVIAADGTPLADIDLEVVINDLVVNASGRLSVATRLGVITLDLHGESGIAR